MDKKRSGKILVVILICAADILWAVGLIYFWKDKNILISVRKASFNLPGIFIQNLAVNLPTVILLIIMLVILRKNFAEELYFKITGRWQKALVVVFLIALTGITLFCLVTKEDKVTILYNLLYYVIFIGFTEEFVVRDVCTWFLRNEQGIVRYLVPNLAFAAMHLFSYASWGKITVPYVLTFVTTDMIGLVCVGCALQSLKEKSGTIWLSVLLHGLADYLVVLHYPVG